MTTRSGTGVGELGCREVVEILGDYLEDAMAPHDRARLERHLADCEGCAAYLDQLRTTIRLSGRLPQEAVTEATMAPLLEAFRAWRREPYYRSDLALVHDLGFGAHAERCAPGVLALLEPVRRRRGLVLELGCGTGLLTRHLVDAGHRVLATDASPAMLARARRAVPGAEEIRQLVLPDDPLPRADAVVSVGHVVNYLPDLASVRSALVAMAGALRPGGVLAIDLCDLSYGQARRNSPDVARVTDDWAIISRMSIPRPDRCVREITTFVRTPDGRWRRDDERHDNVLVDAAQVPALLADHGLDVVVGASFGAEELPTGLVTVVGALTPTRRRRSPGRPRP
jgi:SAM-dependent methyltransferase